ncbi:MAG: alpha/beta hydrolase [Kofleriaceae bacterium]
MIEGVEHRSLTVRDGTRIGYQVRGDRGPAVVLANGLGGTYVAFEHLYDVLGDYRVLCWDYRGLYASGPAADPRANTVAHQVADLVELLDHEGIDRCVVVGWSMGVQVAFELTRDHAERVAGIFAINGTAGRAFHTVMSSRHLKRVIPAMLRIIKAQASLVGRATQVVAGTDATLIAMKKLGMVAPSADLDVFRVVAAGFKTIDWAIYADLLARLDEHDASDVLAAVNVPTTIITGDRDIITPPATAENLHRRVPGSRLVHIDGGSHYTPVEFPAVLQDELARLLARVPGWAAAERDAG